MRAVYDYRTHQRSFRMEYVRIHLLDGIPSRIIVAVAGVPSEMHISDGVFLERIQDFVLIVCHNIVKLIKSIFHEILAPVYKIEDFFRDIEFFCE